ncbi:hypothetical protein C8R45DRAFT_979260 [Mycena sanguinolenta]|nr:hypothetical protein C8R45DRAFT_979260 [Mycena sanguinolenta]
MRLYPETMARRLRYLAEENKKLDVDEISLYAAEILCALKTLHETYHTVHRDLKFDNILISPSGHLSRRFWIISDTRTNWQAEGVKGWNRTVSGTGGVRPMQNQIRCYGLGYLGIRDACVRDVRGRGEAISGRQNARLQSRGRSKHPGSRRRPRYGRPYRALHCEPSTRKAAHTFRDPRPRVFLVYRLRKSREP